jgi:hypothetical protein
MSFPSRLQFPIVVAAATLIVCVLGVRTELKMSEASIAAHQFQTQHAQPAAASIAGIYDEQALNSQQH